MMAEKNKQKTNNKETLGKRSSDNDLATHPDFEPQYTRGSVLCVCDKVIQLEAAHT